jgi:hypothetical protein
MAIKGMAINDQLRRPYLPGCRRGTLVIPNTGGWRPMPLTSSRCRRAAFCRPKPAASALRLTVSACKATGIRLAPWSLL